MKGGRAWRTCSDALPFCTRRLCPRPRIVPSADTRQAPMGTPPSEAPSRASERAAPKPGSVVDMLAIVYVGNQKYRQAFSIGDGWMAIGKFAYLLYGDVETLIRGL